MFGIRYFKATPTTFVLHHVNGRVRHEGTGLSFFYFAPTSTLTAVPVGSTDVPFIFNETTHDFQAVTVQGHLTFRVADPHKLAALLDYTVGAGGTHVSDDPDKLPLRITYAAQNAMRWEDYTQTAVDPADDCTIWYVGDYIKNGAPSDSTRIGAFRLTDRCRQSRTRASPLPRDFRRLLPERGARALRQMRNRPLAARSRGGLADVPACG